MFHNIANTRLALTISEELKEVQEGEEVQFQCTYTVFDDSSITVEWLRKSDETPIGQLFFNLVIQINFLSIYL